MGGSRRNNLSYWACKAGPQPAECTQTERQRVAGLRVRRLRPARLIRAANRIRKTILRGTTESARLIRAANRLRKPILRGTAGPRGSTEPQTGPHSPPDRKNKPQPAERHSYSSSSKCHNLIRPRAAAARRRKNASSNQHDNPSPMIKRYDPQRNLRCLRPFRE